MENLVAGSGRRGQQCCQEVGKLCNFSFRDEDWGLQGQQPQGMGVGASLLAFSHISPALAAGGS